LGRIEVTGRRGRRYKQLLDNRKATGEYWKLKVETLDRTLWRILFGRGYGPVVRQTTDEWRNTEHIRVTCNNMQYSRCLSVYTFYSRSCLVLLSFCYTAA
jgi:hypothetical protein